MNDSEQLQQNNTQEPLQRSARLLVDAFSNCTHVWNDGADIPVKIEEEEEQQHETFRKLPRAAQLITPAQSRDWPMEVSVCQARAADDTDRLSRQQTNFEVPRRSGTSIWALAKLYWAH